MTAFKEIKRIVPYNFETDIWSGNVNYLALLSIVPTVIAFYLGVYVLHRNIRASLNRVFFVLAMFITICTFAEFGYRSAGTIDQATFWINIEALWPIPLAILLHFTILFTKVSPGHLKIWGLIFAYSSSIFFSIVSLVPGLIWMNPVLKYWGWTITYNKNSPITPILTIWTIVLSVCTLLFYIWFYHKNKSQQLRQQAKILFYAIFFPFIVLNILDVGIPNVEIRFPSLFNLAYIVPCIFFAYAIIKLELFGVTPAMAAESILSTMSEGVLISDLEGNVEAINRAALLLAGSTKEQLLGKPIFALFKIGDNISKSNLLAPEVLQNVEIMIKSPFGKDLPVALSKSRLLDAKGRSRGFVYLVEDLASRRQTEENHDILRKVQETQKLNSEILSWASHEMKTPLVPIKGWAQLIYNARKEGKDLNSIFDADDLKALLRNAERLEEIITNFLDAGIIQNRGIPLNKTKVDLLEILTNAKNGIEFYATEKKINLILPSKSYYLNVDKIRLSQVVINLLSNAIKYSPPETSIFVNFQEIKQENKEFLELKIIDQGFGFTSEELTHIFEPFVRVYTQQEAKKYVPGAGLGLYICRHIVEQHGGEISITSEGANKGTTVTIVLPILN